MNNKEAKESVFNDLETLFKPKDENDALGHIIFSQILSLKKKHLKEK